MPDALVFKLDLDINAIRSSVLDDLAKQLASTFKKASPRIRERVGEVAVDAIKESPEYASLLSGRLRNELGVVNPEPILQAVVRNIQNGVFVTSQGARRAGNNIDGGMTIEILKGDYSEVLEVAGANFTSEGTHDIPWLRWLTLEGDAILISDFRFSAGHSAYSRTGDGLMLPKGSWKVPSQFSGVESDNWLTRALDKILPSVEKILTEEIQANL